MRQAKRATNAMNPFPSSYSDVVYKEAAA
jgi:hypothetical protein